MDSKFLENNIRSRLGVMYMKILKSEHKLCLICMEEHEVQMVEIEESAMKGDRKISFQAIYEYCSRADELLETEEMIRKNSNALKASRQSK